MKRLAAFAAALLLCACAGPPSPTRSVEEQLTAIESQRREAIRRGDFAALEQIYAPGFIAIAGNGQVIDRSRLFDVLRQTDSSLAFSTDEVRVQANGDTAVFIGRLVARNAAGAVVFQSRFSHVFVREGGRWVCIAGQSTPIAPA
ncbi:nuclear transport factor 2 family protein [Piscinibacter sp. XHJ-5]|uniref:nuclear transport factor 2 family protein n=1 Tax=Piscinibacter sp. XHJ-5 TaxID=3037797 RepID=UPI002452A4B4|nr:nuclear transport factor 2 family protein [Piscinibacter sp. XHJ-5]